MTLSAPNLAQPILYALLNNAQVVSRLPAYVDSVTIFTRRPAPTDASYPMIIISRDIAKQNLDGISDLRPLITRDIAVYGLNDGSASYRTVETLANIIFGQFHRRRAALVAPDGWTVAAIESVGPLPAPVDDTMQVGRIITLHVQLAQLDL